MKQPDGDEQFRREVFPAELEEIDKRRQGLHLPEFPPERAPSADLGLVGLALSGGGIRSATFSLGVIQALAKHGLLKTVDYLSTVSGGGFIGSCLSSVLNDKDVGTEQDRFPFHYTVGTQEPLAVGQLREGSRYLAPGGLLDKLRIPALALRGVLSNLLIFLFLILLFVFITELVYEVGSRLNVSVGYLVGGGGLAFVILVIGSPLLSRVLRGRSSWAQRNLEEMTFTMILVVVLFLLFLIPTLILVDQSLDTSWVEVKESVMANLLQPFEPRDYPQWIAILVLVVMFMLAGRASANVARFGGKIVLFTLGLLGPIFLFFIFLILLAMEIDSPFITKKELFSLDAKDADQLSSMERVTPELKRRFKDNHIHLSSGAQVNTLREDFRWLIYDGERAFSLVREQNDVSVFPDYQYSLNRGKISPELRLTLNQKGYRLDTQARAFPVLKDNRFKVFGSHTYWVNHDSTSEEWSLEQVVHGEVLANFLRHASYTLPILDEPPGVLMPEGVSLSDDDIEQAIRFVEETRPREVVLLVDNSILPFTDRDGFRRAFRKALEKALDSLGPTVRMAIFLFDDDVTNITGSLTSLTPRAKQTLIQSLFGDEEQESSHLDFQGQRSNIPAALVRGMRELQEKGKEGVRKSIVLISDGVIKLQSPEQKRDLEDWIKNEFSRDAKTAKIYLYGLALSRNANFDLFHSMAIETDGAFYPVFESKMGVRFEDLAGAMEKLKQSAGNQMAPPMNQITMTDQLRDTRYTLTEDKEGIRLRATLQDHTLTPEGLSSLADRWREIFRSFDLELSPEASISRVGAGRWEVKDPYQYTISRMGERLQIRRGSEGMQGWLGGLQSAEIISIIWDDRTDWGLMGLFGVLLVYWLLVDINLTAAHSFYRDRLSKAYLFRVTRSGVVEHFDQQKLSELNTEGSVAPYHLINVALNLQGSKDPSLRGRNTDFFIFSKRFTGSLRTGFLATKEVEGYDGNLNLGTAMAVSGAAAAPNMGVTTMKSLVFVMTLLNIRLGYWLPNPQRAKGASWLTRLALRRGPGPKYVLKESLGRLNLDGQFVNLSDGAHIENLGVYELLRRRCTFIISVDGESDPNMRFGGLVKLLLYARIDMGIEVDIDLDPLRKDEQGVSSRHWVLGTIRYADGKTGHLLYIKSSITGDEYEYVREYRERNPEFPHESTADQFFDETRFEAYRALGYHIGDQLFSHDEAMGEFRNLKTSGAVD
jgi:hypothetical protein